MPTTQKIAEGIFSIDAQMWYPGVASVYLVIGKQIALVETGLSTSAPHILDGIKKLGFDKEDISHIVLTHIHLDHAGSAGILLKELPRAKVFAHKMGASYLVEPTHLLRRARQSLGDTVANLYSLDLVQPVEARRIETVDDGDIIDLGGRYLKVIGAPGHAPHHLCFYENQLNALFCGDLLGTRNSKRDVLYPTTPAPDFNLQSTIDNINELKQLDISTLLFSHFGPSREVDRLLDLSIQKHTEWGQIVREASLEKDDLDYISRKLLERIKGDIIPQSEPLQLQEASIYAQGYLHYFKKASDNNNL